MQERCLEIVKQVIGKGGNGMPPCVAVVDRGRQGIDTFAMGSAYLGASADADVKTGVVSAQVGTIQSAFVAESGATLLEFPTPDETVAAVRNGEATAVFADKDYLIPFAAESNGALVFVGEDIQLGGGVGLGLRQSDTELKAKFDKAIGEMKADGTLNTLIVKYFGEDTVKF